MDKDPNKVKGGKSRAAALTEVQRRDIARNAARVRWAKPGAHDGTGQTPKQPDNRERFHVGASRIRKVLLDLDDETKRENFLILIWPEMPARIARLIAKYPGETIINGGNLLIPNSWKEVL